MWLWLLAHDNSRAIGSTLIVVKVRIGDLIEDEVEGFKVDARIAMEEASPVSLLYLFKSLTRSMFMTRFQFPPWAVD